MILNGIVALIAGFLGAIGVGGGSVLIIFLTLILNMPQLKAQGINLIFFIPCSITGLIFHIKNKLIDYKLAIPLIIFGLIGAGVGFWLNQIIDEYIIRKIFGALLLVIAGAQLYSVWKEKKNKKTFSH